MSAKFTKGEWLVDITNCNVMVKIKKGFGVIVGIFNNEENRANAHLIAASPEMYEELRGVSRLIKQLPLCDSNLYDRAETIDELLTKARGE